MSTIAPARQPFGMVDNSRIRNLASTKNMQAALAVSPFTPSKASLKRRYASPDNSDSENVDPELTKSAAKRKRADDSSDTIAKPAANTVFPLVTQPHLPTSCSKSIPPPKASCAPNTSAPTPSAPIVAAGRSPVKSKRAGLLSSRRSSSGSLQYTRLDAPKHRGNRAPLSLAAALNGTFTKAKRRNVSTIEESMPKEWTFDIHEDTGDEHVVAHNIDMIEIGIGDHGLSDVKGKTTQEQEKENIPPGENIVLVPTRHKTTPVSRKDLMIDEPRMPLGDLKASDYYGDGCDATSSVLVPNDDASAGKTSNHHVTGSAQCNFTSRKDTLLDAASLNALIAGSAPPNFDEKEHINDETEDDLGSGNGEPIEIWESGSAKDEAEAASERNDKSIFSI